MKVIREFLGRYRRDRQPVLADGLLMIGKDCAANMKEPFRSEAHGVLLYDDKGLPR